jgi:hypothetical protein
LKELSTSFFYGPDSVGILFLEQMGDALLAQCSGFGM